MSEVTDALDAPEKKAESSNLGRVALLLLLTGILLLLSWAGWKAWRLYTTSSSLLDRQSELEQLAEADWREIDPDQAETLILGTHADIKALREDTAILMPVLPYMERLPEVGPLAAAAPHLLEMADAGTEAAAYAMRGLKPALQEVQKPDGSGLTLPTLLDTIQAARPDLARSALALDRVAVARQQVTDIETLPWRVRTLLEKGDEWLPVGQDFTRLSLALPELMGYEGPRRYLILAQNQDELRPTGGFISGAGYLELEDGEVLALDFADANLIDAWEEPGKIGGSLLKPYATPPMPLRDFMLLDLFLFRDANFWPDFAVSGQKAMDLYAYGRDVPPLDGVIGINQEFLKLLLQGMGPLSVPETGETINSKNIIKSLQEAWTLQDGVAERKAFLGPFAAAILQRVGGGLGDIDPLNLLRNTNQALNQKDLQIFVRDPQTAALLAANNWDGRLPAPSSGDVLLVVDTNVGYNKANFLVDRAVDYQVQLADTGMNEARLTVRHNHNGEANDEPCWQGTLQEYADGAPYLALTDKCYWNYLRVYAPAGSELISGPERLIPGQTWYGGYDWQKGTETLLELPGYTTFTSWMLLPRGEEISSEFRYNLPDSIIQREDGASIYTLQLVKQAGTRPTIVQVALTPPPGSTVINAEPEPMAIENNTYIFSIELDQDQTVTLTYQ